MFDALTVFYVQPIARKTKIKNNIYSKFIANMAYNIAKDNVVRKKTQCDLYYYFYRYSSTIDLEMKSTSSSVLEPMEPPLWSYHAEMDIRMWWNTL